jgi:hypothetical protein
LKVWSAGLAAVLLLGSGITQTEAASRLEWGATRVAWHDACTFSHEGGAREHASRHRFVVIQGTLRSMAREDASLYAVFLDSQHDLPTLQERLAIESLHDLRADSGRPFCCEWIPLATNGRLTLFVDEARQAGKTVVAIVNAKGDILGAHRLWTSGDLAQAG